jgi:hypothetical protein
MAKQSKTTTEEWPRTLAEFDHDYPADTHYRCCKWKQKHTDEAIPCCAVHKRCARGCGTGCGFMIGLLLTMILFIASVATSSKGLALAAIVSAGLTFLTFLYFCLCLPEEDTRYFHMNTCCGPPV